MTIRTDPRAYNIILTYLDTPKTVAELSELTGMSKQLVLHYMNKLLNNSKNGKVLISRVQTKLNLTSNNVKQYTYKRHVRFVTHEDLTAPRAVQKKKPVKVEVKPQPIVPVQLSNTREIKLLSKPTAEQRKTLDEADKARRKERNKRKTVNIGSSSLNSIYM